MGYVSICDAHMKKKNMVTIHMDEIIDFMEKK